VLFGTADWNDDSPRGKKEAAALKLQ